MSFLLLPPAWPHQQPFTLYPFPLALFLLLILLLIVLLFSVNSSVILLPLLAGSGGGLLILLTFCSFAFFFIFLPLIPLFFLILWPITGCLFLLSHLVLIITLLIIFLYSLLVFLIFLNPPFMMPFLPSSLGALGAAVATGLFRNSRNLDCFALCSLFCDRLEAGLLARLLQSHSDNFHYQALRLSHTPTALILIVSAVYLRMERSVSIQS